MLMDGKNKPQNAHELARVATRSRLFLGPGARCFNSISNAYFLEDGLRAFGLSGSCFTGLQVQAQEPYV